MVRKSSAMTLSFGTGWESSALGLRLLGFGTFCRKRRGGGVEARAVLAVERGEVGPRGETHPVPTKSSRRRRSPAAAVATAASTAATPGAAAAGARRSARGLVAWARAGSPVAAARRTLRSPRNPAAGTAAGPEVAARRAS
jgi:hypothetical protein